MTLQQVIKVGVWHHSLNKWTLPPLPGSSHKSPPSAQLHFWFVIQCCNNSGRDRLRSYFAWVFCAENLSCTRTMVMRLSGMWLRVLERCGFASPTTLQEHSEGNTGSLFFQEQDFHIACFLVRSELQNMWNDSCYFLDWFEWIDSRTLEGLPVSIFFWLLNWTGLL